jgi:hypothetical protein
MFSFGRVSHHGSVTPDWFRGPPFRDPKSFDRAAPWMPEPARHDGEEELIWRLEPNGDTPDSNGITAELAQRPRASSVCAATRTVAVWTMSVAEVASMTL